MRAIVEKNQKNEKMNEKKYNRFMQMWQTKKNDQFNKNKIAKKMKEQSLYASRILQNWNNLYLS